MIYSLILISITTMKWTTVERLANGCSFFFANLNNGRSSLKRNEKKEGNFSRSSPFKAVFFFKRQAGKIEALREQAYTYSQITGSKNSSYHFVLYFGFLVCLGFFLDFSRILSVFSLLMNFV